MFLIGMDATLEQVCRELKLDEEQCTVLEEFLPSICPPCEVAEAKKTRKRSPYQEHLSVCLKKKGIKKFGEAGEALKGCAQEWREKKAKEKV